MSTIHIGQCDETAAHLRSRMPEADHCGVLVIAGSGLGGFVRGIEASTRIPYGELPNVGGSTVVGHAGELILGRLPNSPSSVLVMAGRRHFYEGIGAQNSVLLSKALLLAFPSLKTVVISNAAGGLNPCFEVGELMIISDHVNWISANPLIGPNREEWGPRFPDMCGCYSPRLRQIAKQAATDLGLMLREGVYIAGHGPSYETRAEVTMLRTILGGDAVGMSTVPETLVATHLGREVLGISFISNTLTKPAVTTHDEVMENARRVETSFGQLIAGIIDRIS